jgi:predicted RNA-binding Zn-ribbon protein involved in translation (DUF1610 family)
MESMIRCSRCDQQVDAAEPSCPACGHLHGEPSTCERHPGVEARGLCVICGSPVCAECDADEQVHYSCPAHAGVPVIEGWAQIYTTSDTVEAELIKENLQSEGLDAAVLSQKDRILTFDLGDFSPVRVLVPAYAYLDAARVLSGHMDAAGEVVFACPTCGEAFEEADATCRACGSVLPTRGGASYADQDTGTADPDVPTG